MRRLVIPLASYLAVTIVVPVLNGAPLDRAFLEHAILAIALPLIITGMLSALPRARLHAAPRQRHGAPQLSSRRDL